MQSIESVSGEPMGANRWPMFTADPLGGQLPGGTLAGVVPLVVPVGVSLDFNVIERLVVYSSEPLTNIAVASNEFSFEVLDSQGNSVFGGLLGSNPSIARLLSSPATGAQTYNNATFVPGHIYPGPGATTFQTAPLPPGDYSFTIKGTSTAYVTALPEPGMTSALAIAAAGGAAWLRRRRPPPRSIVHAPRN